MWMWPFAWYSAIMAGVTSKGVSSADLIGTGMQFSRRAASSNAGNVDRSTLAAASLRCVSAVIGWKSHRLNHALRLPHADFFGEAMSLIRFRMYRCR